jgi:hypothetical protein
MTIDVRRLGANSSQSQLTFSNDILSVWPFHALLSLDGGSTMLKNLCTGFAIFSVFFALLIGQIMHFEQHFSKASMTFGQ